VRPQYQSGQERINKNNKPVRLGPAWLCLVGKKRAPAMTSGATPGNNDNNQSRASSTENHMGAVLGCAREMVARAAKEIIMILIG
jgi:hypothetical protein